MCWRDDLRPMSYWHSDADRARALPPDPPPAPPPKCRVYPGEACTEKDGCIERELGCAQERPF